MMRHLARESSLNDRHHPVHPVMGRPITAASMHRITRPRRRPSQLIDRALDPVPDRQTLTFISAGAAPPFALAPLLPSPKDKSKQKYGRDDHQRQKGAHRRAAVRRSMIGQGW